MAGFSKPQRILPEPPTSRGEERLDGWGFSDSGFRIDERGEVEFMGSRYAIGGKKIPALLQCAASYIVAQPSCHLEKRWTRRGNPYFVRVCG